MADLDFHGFANDITHHGYAAVAVLTLILCECLSTLEDEVQCIWLSPWSKTKCTYLFARYFALFYVITAVVFSLMWPPPLPVPPSKCIKWYLHGMTCFSAQYIASHITLTRKIIATYEVGNVGSALLVFHVSELAGALYSGKDSLSAAKFNGVCDVLIVPHAGFVFVGIFLLGQVLIWALILRGSRRPGSPASSRLTVREMIYQMWYDGEAKAAWVLCGLVFVIAAYRAATGQTIKPVYLFAWPICLISVGTCRYILSMERNANTHTKTSQHEVCETGREPHICDDSNCTGNLPPGRGAPPTEALPDSFHSKMSNRPHAAPVSYSDSLETVSSETLRWNHPSCLQRFSDSDVSIANTSSSVSSDLAHRTITSTNSYVSTLRRLSISTRATQETEITAPSIGDGGSLDIEIGSLHSSSSATSEELREFWNEVWSRDEHAFPHA